MQKKHCPETVQFVKISLQMYLKKDLLSINASFLLCKPFKFHVFNFRLHSIRSTLLKKILITFFSLGEPSATRREAVKKKTAEYLMRAEQISSQYLRSNMGQGSTQTVVSGSEMLVHRLSVLYYTNVLYMHASTRFLTRTAVKTS